MKKKLKLDDLKVKSFVTGEKIEAGITPILSFGVVCVVVAVSVYKNCTGNCGTAVNVTCEKGCDFKSIPVNECIGGHE